MIQFRHWTAIVLAGCIWSEAAVWSQDTSGGSSAGGSSGGGSSSGGTSGAGGSSGGASDNGTGTTGGGTNGSSTGKGSGTGTGSGSSNNGSGTNGTGTSGTSGGSTGSPFGGTGGSPFGTPGGSPFGTPGSGSPFGTPFGSGGSSSFGAPTGSSSFGTTGFGTSGTTGNGQGGQNGQGGTGAGTGTTPEGTGGLPGGTGEGTTGGTTPGAGGGPTQKPTVSQPPSPFQAPGLSTGASSSFGATPGSGVKPSAQSFATFSLPAAYGGTSQVFNTGEGRFSRPHFVYLAGLQMGFDDNVFQTPSHQTAPAPVLVQAAVPAQFAVVQVPNSVPSTPGSNSFFGPPPPTTVPGTHPEVVQVSPAQKAVFQKVPFTPQQRVESLLMRATLGMDVQFATRQTIFTMDLRGTSDTYFERPGRSTDPNGTIGFNFIHRFTSRFQFDATGTFSYSTQPNVASPNSPVAGDAAYITFNGRTDVSYRWSKRFTTVTSISLNTFEQDGIPTNTSYETIFGTEARYLWSPRLTAVGEVRYAIKTFPNSSPQDSQNTYVLGGADVILSSRFTGTVRVGASFDRFTNAGGSASTPYGETSVAWRFSPTGSVSWSSRYGFEDPPNTNTTVLTFRTGITAMKALSSRLRVSAGVSYANSRSTSQLMTAQTVVNSSGTTNTVFTSNNSTETTMSVSAGVEYLLTRRMTLNTNWTYTDVLTSQKLIDYNRNQIFFGVDYTF